VPLPLARRARMQRYLGCTEAAQILLSREATIRAAQNACLSKV
jgi:hypothetical protein